MLAFNPSEATPTKTTVSRRKMRISSSIPTFLSFFRFAASNCRDETKRQKGRSGNVHLYFTRAGRLIDSVSSKALSRFPRFPFGDRQEVLPDP